MWGYNHPPAPPGTVEATGFHKERQAKDEAYPWRRQSCKGGREMVPKPERTLPEATFHWASAIQAKKTPLLLRTI